MQCDSLYIYFVKDFGNGGRLMRREARCTVIDESDKSYRIKLGEPIATRYEGDVIWVKKKNIIKSTGNS